MKTWLKQLFDAVKIWPLLILQSIGKWLNLIATPFQLLKATILSIFAIDLITAGDIGVISFIVGNIVKILSAIEIAAKETNLELILIVVVIYLLIKNK